MNVLVYGGNFAFDVYPPAIELGLLKGKVRKHLYFLLEDFAGSVILLIIFDLWFVVVNVLFEVDN
jgi:hypothetical protein